MQVCGRVIALVLSAALGAGCASPTFVAPESGPEREAEAVFRVERDAYGIPSIHGKTDADAAFGLAHAHAEDDFPNIQRQLLAVRGELGAVDGKAGARIDYFGKVTRVAETVEAGYDGLSPETIRLLEGYAAGLNAYAAAHPEEVLRRGLFPVTPEDVVGGFVLVSPLFFGLDKVVGALAEGGPLPMETGPARRGSNAFAFAPSRTKSGGTVLLSNSHQPWEGLAAWYEARVSSGEGWRFSGALFPGAPLPLQGYNRHLGWANTVNRPDMIDVYRLVLSDDAKRYRLDGEWRPLDCERFWLKVKTGPFVLPVPQKQCRSVHGPVFSSKKGAFALRYAGMGEVRQVEQYYRLTKARSLEEWLSAMKMRAVPATNFVYADAEGNIGLLYNALIPERREEADWAGVLPGDRSALIWQDYVPFEGQPFLLNPPSGYVVNANNTPFLATSPGHDLDPAAFSHAASIEKRVTNRILRAIELIEGHGEGAALSRAEIEAIKFDKSYTPTAPITQRFMALAAAGTEDEQIQEAIRLLSEWDYSLDGVGRADALAALVMKPLYRTSYHGAPLAPAEEIVGEAAALLRRHHGRLDPPLGEVLRHRRGVLDLPLTGGPDVLRAIGWEAEADGRLVADFGDSFILLVEWPAQGGEPAAEAINPYGAAPGRPSSPHHADQAGLFAREELRPAPLPAPASR